MGRIVQDGDPNCSSDERERHYLRYIELVDQVDGNEDREVFDALIASMHAIHDYGAYQSTMRAAFSFPPRNLGVWLLEALPGWLDRDPERAGDWLGQLAFLGRESAAVVAFNETWAGAEGAFRHRLKKFVAAEEVDGWLRTPAQRGVLSCMI